MNTKDSPPDREVLVVEPGQRREECLEQLPFAVAAVKFDLVQRARYKIIKSYYDNDNTRCKRRWMVSSSSCCPCRSSVRVCVCVPVKLFTFTGQSETGKTRRKVLSIVRNSRQEVLSLVITSIIIWAACALLGEEQPVR